MTSNLFDDVNGLGTIGAPCRHNTGDIIAIAQEKVVLLDPERADKEGAMVGHHGGDSSTESTVPLLTTTRN